MINPIMPTLTMRLFGVSSVGFIPNILKAEDWVVKLRLTCIRTLYHRFGFIDRKPEMCAGSPRSAEVVLLPFID